MIDLKNEISNKEYHSKTEYLSSSMLKLILDNPEMYYKKYILKNEKDEHKDHFDTGTAIHAHILEPDEYAKNVVFFEGTRRGKVWDEFKKINEDKLILGDLQRIQLDNMYNAFIKSEQGPKLISGGQAEVSLFTELSNNAVKVRADYINFDKKYIIDVKSTSGIITEEKFKQMVEGKFGGYDIQAALYVDAYSNLLKRILIPIGSDNYSNIIIHHEIYSFYWIVISKDFDDIKFFKASEALIKQGREKYKKAMRLIEKYNKDGWNFSNDIIEIFPSNINMEF